MKPSLACILFLAACNSEPLAFVCHEDSQCVVGGVAALCVDRDENGKGVCAISDPACLSGFRYDESAGSRANECYVSIPDLATPVDTDMATTADLLGRDLSGTVDLEQPDLVTADLVIAPTWKPETAPPRPGGGVDQFTSVWASGPNDVYIAGFWIYRTTDRAATWSPSTFVTTNPGTVYSLWGSSASDVYAGGNGSKVWRSTGNNSFSSLTVNTPLTAGAVDIWGSINGSDVFIAGSAGSSAQYMMKVGPGKTDVSNLNSTNQFPSTLLSSLCTSSGGGVVFASTSYIGGSILKSTDGGVTFTSVFANANKGISSIWCSSDGQTVVGVGSGGQIVRTANAGMSFNDESVATTEALLSVHGIGASELWAVGGAGVIYHYRIGMGWTAETSNTTKRLTGVHAISATDVWAVGDDATIRHYSP